MLTLRDYQNDCLDALGAGARRGVKRMLVALPTGCHRSGQGILMYDGSIKAVEAIEIGDALMGPDSQPRYVLQLAQGVGEMMEVRPVKGRPFVVNKDHILSLVRTNQRTNPNRIFPSTLGGGVIDIPITAWKRWSKTQKHLHKIFRTGVNFPSPDGGWPMLPPYILGVYLGDGTLATEGITCLTSKHKEIIREFASVGSSLGLKCRHDGIMHHLSGIPKRRNPFTEALRALGLSGLRSEDRFIPQSYKVATRANRLEILAGLLDTDGSLTEQGYDFLSKSPKLADDVAFLARSLGLAAYLNIKRINQGRYAGYVYHRVSISGDCSTIPVKVEYKKAAERKQIKNVLRTGFQIIPTETTEQFFGFCITGDGRYLLDDFTVTHNTGKTVIFSALPAMIKNNRRMLVIAHRKELLDQSAEKIRWANPDLLVDIEQAERHASPLAQVVVASIQTLSVTPERLAALDPRDFAIIVIDEAHHAPANTYLKLLHRFHLGPNPEQPGETKTQRQQAFKTFAPKETAPFLIGFTATPNRTDGIGLEAVFDEIAYSRTIEDMMRAGWLCKIVGKQVQTGVSLAGVKVSHGDFQEGQLAQAVNLAERNELAVKSYLGMATGRSCLVFCVDVEHTQAMCQAFQDVGLAAEYVVGSTAKDQRDGIIAAYRAGKVPVLANCMVLTEGFDAPETSCIIMARPTKSQLMYTQMIGRGTRIASGKENLLVIDLVDAGSNGVADLNALFGLPPALETPDGVLAAQEELARAKASAAAEARTIEEVKQLARNFNPLGKGKLPFWFKGGLRWTSTSWGYALHMKAGAITVRENLLGQFEVKIHPRTGIPDYILGKYPSEEEAISQAESLVVREFPGQVAMIAQEAPWHDQPASQKQLDRLRQWRVSHPAGITKKQAGDLMEEQIKKWRRH